MNNTNTHRAALFATLGVVTVLVIAGLVASQTAAATRTLRGRGIAQTGAGADSIPVFFTVTSPNDEKVNGETAEIKTGKAKVYEHLGQTDIGGPLEAVKKKRIRSQNVNAGKEISFRGKYTVGDAKSVTADEVFVHDRDFVVCGKLQGITRRTAAGANLDELTIEVTKRTAQEKRYESFFALKKDVVFSFKDGTQFHNAAGSWKKPTGRVSIQAADVTANQQNTRVAGEITKTATREVSTVDIGVKCD